ncbi:RES family NAD+ phosphorylase [Sphingobacterium sp. SGG-5]|uniref:RES family NAD+ phosphorylase n=1 Tax=Sphingobacterium sp. SGG-5 TaxID=2710881 RepID=UPI0013EB07BF|nr:RES family NAD+ phosphorylase [Sphingobacterium sp. SGG-5]NGM60544.1 RES family NAD+ phosphorylase [Sphingobacterium sp. SGG-5]
MKVYRITLAKFSEDLKASGRAARWNSNDVQMIYTASSRSLACLENVVHRNQLGLSALFKAMIVEIPDALKIKTIDTSLLHNNWKDYDKIVLTQKIGDRWISDMETAVLKVPSSIIDREYNYLINPLHPDFKRIKLVQTEPFVFDERIKR